MPTSNHLPHSSDLPHQHWAAVTATASQAKLPLLTSSEGQDLSQLGETYRMVVPASHLNQQTAWQVVGEDHLSRPPAFPGFRPPSQLPGEAIPKGEAMTTAAEHGSVIPATCYSPTLNCLKFAKSTRWSPHQVLLGRGATTLGITGALAMVILTPKVHCTSPADGRHVAIPPLPHRRPTPGR